MVIRLAPWWTGQTGWTSFLTQGERWPHASDLHALRFQPTPLHELHLDQHPFIDISNASDKPLQSWKQFLFQACDFFLPIGPIHPGAPQRLAPMRMENLLNGVEGGFQEQEGIFLRATEWRGGDRGCGHDG